MDLNNKLGTDIKTPNPDLPPQVQTNIDLDKKNYQVSQNIEPQKEVPIQKDGAEFSLKENLKKFRAKIPLRKILKIVLIIFSVIVSIFGILFILTVTNNDVRIFKITLSGTVTDRLSGNLIEGAQIFIDDELKATTNANGKYSIGGLELGNVEIKVVKDKYQESLQQIPITRLFLNYNTTRNFELTPSERAVVEGKFSVEDANYRFIDERIYIDEEEFRLNLDGSFRLENILIGELREFNFKSINFKDVDQNIEIKPGINVLPEIKLSPSGDIDGSLISYVRQDVVNNIQFNIENINQNQIELNSDKFKIKDLDIDREYSIRVIAEGYKTRDYKITIKQGLNVLFDFQLVENGSVVFLKEDPQTDRTQFFISDFDGVNAKKVSNFASNTNISNYFYSTSENKIYFQSDRETISGASSSLRPVYQIELTSNLETRVTQNVSEISSLYINYRAKKMVDISRIRVGNTNPNVIKIMDLDGNNRIELKQTSSTIDQVSISDDGKFVFLNIRGTSISTISRIDVATKEERNVIQGTEMSFYDSITNGNRVLYSRKNNQTNFINLFYYDFSNQEERTIDDNLSGQDFQFINNEENRYLYFDQKDGRFNVFQYDLAASREDNLTNIFDQQIRDIFQQDQYLFYQTTGSLYILDIYKPINLKLVYEL